MRSLAPALLVSLTLPAAAQLDVRAPVELQSTSLGDAPFIATDAELSVAVLREAFDADLVLRTSDGRGVSWGPAIAIDPVDDGASTNFQQAAVVGDRAFVAWADGRFQITIGPSAISRVPFVRAFDGTTQSFGPEIQIPTNSDPTQTGCHGLAFDAVKASASTRLQLASIQAEPLGPSDNLARIVHYTSSDLGATWSQAIVTPSASPNFTDLRMVAEGDTVDLFWIDGLTPLGAAIQHARSTDGGLTFGAPQAIPGIVFTSDYAVDVEGDLIVAVGNSLDFQTFVGTIEHTASTDGGATWAPVQGVVGSAALNVFDVMWPDVAIRPGTDDVTLAFSGQDLALGSYHIMRMHSSDGGASWLPVAKVSTAAGYHPTIQHATDGGERAVVTWRDQWGDGRLSARVSLDSGVSFGGDEPELSGFAGRYTHAWNDRYQNVLVGRAGVDAPKATSVIGFRPADIDLAGFTGGSTSLSIDFANMTGGADLALFVVSSTEGALALPAPDGRNSGLGASPLLNATLGFATSGVFAAPLVNAAGSTGAIPTLPLQPGLTAFGLGLSIDLGTGAFVDLTDVMRIDT